MNSYFKLNAFPLWVAVFFLWTGNSVFAGEQRTAQDSQIWISKRSAVSLVELYTSEGCHSCPPAERWMNSLTSHPRLFKDFVPVAFHVDYWNYLGWQDRFAKNAYSRRQRDLHSQGIFSGVYTPGMSAGSKEWHGWRRQSPIPVLRETVGTLSAILDTHELEVSFEHSGRYTLNLAYLGMGFSTKVTAGENNRKILNHEFVVLKHWKKTGDGNWNISLPTVPKENQKQTALAIWLTERGSERVVQAVGGYLP